MKIQNKTIKFLLLGGLISFSDIFATEPDTNHEQPFSQSTLSKNQYGCIDAKGVIYSSDLKGFLLELKNSNPVLNNPELKNAVKLYSQAVSIDLWTDLTKRITQIKEIEANESLEGNKKESRKSSAQQGSTNKKKSTKSADQQGNTNTSQQTSPVVMPVPALNNQNKSKITYPNKASSIEQFIIASVRNPNSLRLIML